MHRSNRHDAAPLSAAVLVASLPACRGPDLSFDCDHQSEQFARVLASEPALLPEPPDQAPYPVAVAISEEGVDRLVQAAVGEMIPFSGDVPFGGFSATFEPKGAPRVVIDDVPGCVDCVFFDLDFYLTLQDGIGGGGSGVGTTRLGVPLELRPGAEDVMELWANYDGIRVESLSFVAYGFDSQEHEALTAAMRTLIEEKIREQYAPTHVMDFQPWNLGSNSIRLVARKLFIFPDTKTLSVGMQTNLPLPEGAGLPRPEVPDGANLSVAFHGATFLPILRTLAAEGAIPRRYEEDGTPSENGGFAVTIDTVEGQGAPQPDAFRVQFRVWKLTGTYCGYAVAQMLVDGAFDGRVLRMAPGAVGVLEGEGAGAVAAQDEELVREHENVVDTFKGAVAEQLELAVGLSAVDLPGHDVVLEDPRLDIEPAVVTVAADFFTVVEP